MVAVCLLLLFSGCTSSDKLRITPFAGVSGAGNLASLEAAILELVVRDALPGERWAREAGVRTYFLGINHQDPSAEFLARFSDLSIPVKPQSDGRGDVTGFYDKSDRSEGLLVFVEKLQWLLPGQKAEVTVGYFTSGLSASGWKCVVELKHGEWVITQTTVLWVS